VKAGLKLEGLVEGMGAQAAGLQTNDVVVKLGDKRITGFASLGAALQGHRAGDVVPVVFYRRAEKKTIELTLSARPVPEIPATPVELADAVRKLYAETDVQLEQLFASVPEAMAAVRPTPNDWNALEILAHLILAERDQVEFVAELLAGNERWYDGYTDNLPAPIQALLAVYPTAPDLLGQLKRTEAEGAALIAALPPEFTQRKGSYWRLGMTLPFRTRHIHEHLGQLKAALEAAQV
jgi:membrane-associated protease RseP (regulator of RpoE activity)